MGRSTVAPTMLLPFVVTSKLISVQLNSQDDGKEHKNDNAAVIRSIPTNLPTIELRNGVQLPVLSLGTAHRVRNGGDDHNKRFNGFLPERTYRQVQLALECGVRSFDTARLYRNHKQIGHVFGEWFRTGKIQREDVFISTKVFHGNAEHVATQRSHMHNMDQLTPDEVTEHVKREVEDALDDLGIGYIDLLLLHWPSCAAASNGRSCGSNGPHGTNKETDEERKTACRLRRLAAWNVLEEFYEKGWVRAIGVSNFSEHHLNDLLYMDCGVKIIPMVNQIEANLGVMYPDIFRYCKEHRIVCQAFSPFKRGQDLKLLLHEDITIQATVQKYRKSVQQITLRMLQQYGYAITFLSTNPQRMVSNHEIFDFELTESEFDFISNIPTVDGSCGLRSPYDLD